MTASDNVPSKTPPDAGDRPTRAEDRSGSLDLLLWFGVLGGAIAWLVHLMLSYGIAEFGCVSQFHELRFLGFTAVAWLEVGVSLLTLAVAIAATLIARRNTSYFSGEVEAARVESGDPRVFMARSGMLSSGIFAFIIAVQALPILFYLRDC